jgi:uncharacterized protein YqeY
MSLEKRIVEDLKRAMKNKDQVRTSCLRMLKTSLKNKQVEVGRELKEEEVRAILSSMIKKGKEAAAEFKKGGREDLCLKEEKEIEVYYEYLPRQLSPEEIENTLKAVIAELSAAGPKDLGRVMKAAMARMAGQAQGKEVNEIARKLLTG